MSYFRHTLLFIGAFAISAAAQEEKLKTLNEEPASFAISTGSMFSATGKTATAKPTEGRFPALKAISNDLTEALSVVKQNHITGKKLKDATLVGSAIESMLHKLDPHSNYYTPEEFSELNNDHQGRYFGIGTTITNFTQNGVFGTYVLAVTKNTPAERAGLKFGDRIVEVDGRSVAGMNSFEVRNRVRGKIGSSVSLTVERSDGSLVRNIGVKRDRVPQSSVPASFILENQTGYIALTEGFGYATAEEFDTAFRSLKRAGMKSLIIDIRGNGGGLMDQAVMIAETFLPFGQKIVSQRGRSAADDREWTSRNRQAEMMPLAILVDGESASASEILAAAMQDNDRAVIIGERTYGKALVQSVFDLGSGAGLALTSDRYYSPSGRSLQREYADSGLYDYFRHTNHGALIDKPENAVRTRTGRVVFGGDGVQPEILIEDFNIDPKRLVIVDRIFESYRAGKILSSNEELARVCESANIDVQCENELPFMRSQLAQFAAYRSGPGSPAAVEAVRINRVVQMAIGSLMNTSLLGKTKYE